MAAAPASRLKYEDFFTVQLHRTGPVGFIVVDVALSGDIRGYVRFARERIATWITERDAHAHACVMAPLLRLLGVGRMIFVVDQGPETERYQGVPCYKAAPLADTVTSSARPN
jgi:molecular chaperone Hsp33